MSANALANEAVSQLLVARNQEAPPPQQANNALALDNALSALSTYIPAEAMALYLAVSSSMKAITDALPDFDPVVVYWSFVFGFSPGLFLLAYFVKLAKTSSPLPSVQQFPWFRMLSSILAFAVWGRCVPGNPFVPTDKNGLGVLYGIIATIVSILLPSAETIFNWIIELRSRQVSGPNSNGTQS